LNKADKESLIHIGGHFFKRGKSLFLCLQGGKVLQGIMLVKFKNKSQILAMYHLNNSTVWYNIKNLSS
jgi:hypothetical protein